MEDSIPLNPMSTSLDVSDGLSVNEIFEGSFDSKFFDKVEKRYKEKIAKAAEQSDGTDTDNKLWDKSVDEIRAERIYEKYSDSGKDPVVAIVKDWMKIFDERAVNDKQLNLSKRDFRNKLARLASILIDKECETSHCAKGKHKCKYGGESPHIFTDPENDTEKTLLHIAAEEGLYILMLELMSRFSNLLLVGTFGAVSQLPVELALKGGHDDVTSAIIKKMDPKCVRDLFQFDDMKEKCTICFGDIINNPNMKKTVVAVLDSLVTPLGADQMNPEDKLRLSGVPDVPTRYHFSYQILDGDNEGRSKKCKTFNSGSDSCFKLLLQSSHKETIIHHPVIRILTNSKWDKFGRFWIRSYAFIFVLYLLALSIGLLGAVNCNNPLLYKTNFDYLRGFCEGVTLLGAIVYLLLEIVQLSKERFNYFHDVHNFSDVCGVLLIFAVVPLRCLNLDSQWTVAAFAYLVNFFRMFKYFPAWKFVGIYSKILMQILLFDFTKFAVVYLFMMLSFAGSLFLALRATSGNGNFADAILVELKGFFGGLKFHSHKANAVIIILLVVDMLIVTLMLFKMLVAQMSYRYKYAQTKAELHYDIGKCLMIAKLEQSSFKNLGSKYYECGETVLMNSKMKKIFDEWEKVKEDLGDE
eukprot:gene20477-22493_t